MRAFVTMSALVMSLTGCVVPVMEEAPFKADVVEPIVIGDSSRADVLSTLGEPDRVLAKERLFAYGSYQLHAVLVIGAAYSAAFIPVGSNHILLVEFDGDAIVRAVETRSTLIAAGGERYCLADGVCVSLRETRADLQAAGAARMVETADLAHRGDAAAQFDMYAMSDTLDDGGYLWLCRSAANGFAVARYTLARHYLGEGPEPRTPDPVHAYKWLRLFAQADGDRFAGLVASYEARLAGLLSDEERAVAEALVRDWRPDPAACAARAAGRAT